MKLVRADRFIELVFTLVADPDDDRALDRISLFGKGHVAGDASEILDPGQGITDRPAVFLDPAGELAGILYGSLHKPQGIPGGAVRPIGAARSRGAGRC